MIKLQPSLHSTYLGSKYIHTFILYIYCFIVPKLYYVINSFFYNFVVIPYQHHRLGKFIKNCIIHNVHKLNTLKCCIH